MPATRRELFSTLPAVLLPAILKSKGSRAEEPAMPAAVYPFDKLPVRTPNDAQIRRLLKGRLATGEPLEVHETTLLPGGAPHPPHHHVHSQMWLIRAHGASYRLGAGSVGFVHSNNEHGIKNVGEWPATYFVVAMGPGTHA